MNKKIVSIFILLTIIMADYSFVVPTYGKSECWKDLNTLADYKGHRFDSFDKKLVSKVLSLADDFHLNCDAGGFVLLAHDFPGDYFRGRFLFINRPALPFLVNLVARPFHLLSDSYSMTFAAALLVNLTLFFCSLLLLYSLVRKYFSERAAFLSGVFFILSPFTRVWLVQPETNVFGIFVFVSTLYLLDNYLAKPSTKKLIAYSLIVGLFLLGKLNFAITIFVLLLALYYRKIKEGSVFFILHLAPTLAWYLVVTKLWGLPFGVQEISSFGAGVWILEALKQPFYVLAGELFRVVPGYFGALFYGFLGAPVVFALIGLWRSANRRLTTIFIFLHLSLLALLFVMHIYLPRWTYFSFVIMYPLAVVGIDWLAGLIKDGRWRTAYYGAAYFLMIAPAFINIVKMYGYLEIPYS